MSDHHFFYLKGNNFSCIFQNLFDTCGLKNLCVFIILYHDFFIIMSYLLVIFLLSNYFDFIRFIFEFCFRIIFKFLISTSLILIFF